MIKYLVDFLSSIEFQVLDYLNEFVDKFELKKYIHFNTKELLSFRTKITLKLFITILN